MFIGVDIGGTDIKLGVVAQDGTIIKKEVIPTAKETDIILSDIVSVCSELCKEYDITAVGVGTPGVVNDGVVENPKNLPFRNTPISKILSEALNLPVRLGNDGHCAGFAEAIVGCAKDYKNVLVVTLGTGIGGAIIIDKKLYKGAGGGAGEVGHITLDRNGPPCHCGKNGCFESYASVTALINQTKEAIEKYPDSILTKISKAENKVNGKTVFTAIEKGCPVAQNVYDTYITYLSEGINSAITLLQPDIVVLGGSISREGERLVSPLKIKIMENICIKTAQLNADAGIIGAAMLCY